MSSYLNIYFKIKDSDKKVLFNYWSRNSEIYQRFYELLQIGYKPYTDITQQNILDIINYCNSSIEQCKSLKSYWKQKQDEAEECLGTIVQKMSISNPAEIVKFISLYREQNDFSEDINGQDELIEDYKHCIELLNFLLEILDKSSDIEGLCCNIS